MQRPGVAYVGVVAVTVSLFYVVDSLAVSGITRSREREWSVKCWMASSAMETGRSWASRNILALSKKSQKSLSKVETVIVTILHLVGTWQFGLLVSK